MSSHSVGSGPTRVVQLISRLAIGGASQNVCQLAAKLDAREFTTWLACGRAADGERNSFELAREVGIEPIYVDALQPRPGTMDFCALAAVRRLLRDTRPHLLHTHTAKAGAVGRIAGLLNILSRENQRPRLIHTFHGHVFNGYFGRCTSRAIVIVERNLARISDAIVVVGQSVKRDITEIYRVAPAEKVHVIRLGFEFDWTARMASHRGWLRARFGIPSGTTVIGSIGRMTEIKNFPLALDGFRRLLLSDHRRSARLVLFGDGALRPTLKRHARQLGIASRVHFAGWELDLARIYSDLNVVCLTSLNEGTPVALIEALAAGVPVVATDVGGVRDVVSDGIDGELTDSGDADALAAALARVARREGLSSVRRDAVRRDFSVARQARDMARLYQQVLEQ